MPNRLETQTTTVWKALSLGLLIVAIAAVIIAAVSLTPVAGDVPSTEAAVLQKQLEFILKTNSAFLGFLGIIGALLTWFFKNNLQDAKVVAAQMVREEMDSHIKARVEEEFRYWEMSAKTERVIGQTLVDYYLPGGGAVPEELHLVKQRGFRQVSFCDRAEQIRRSEADVVIVDLQNAKGADGSAQVVTDKGKLTAESEQWAQRQIDTVRAVTGNGKVLVVYVRGTVAHLNSAELQQEYVLAANNQVTLVGHAGNGAYVALGARRKQQ
ncbi:MAG: hypothetical protein DCF25_16250 [Leptolyngbya foveolarum]|uniref:Uncharacterized protein n=1 Tax=Leptolyngbya foveolarum TaxID=47253 RepID=A0A2W4VM43_9CYAN|nr:MAG: hypothetical protein DCF25_16250 [Leptolyngbya foveolarum]